MRHALWICLSLFMLPQARAAEPETFAVLRISEGDKVAFKAVASKEAPEERKRLVKASEQAIKDWEARKAAFAKDRTKKGKEFLEPRPPVAAVKVVKDKLATQQEAVDLAKAEQEKSDGKCAVVRITDPSGREELAVLREGKVKEKEWELKQDYAKAMDDWQAKVQAYAVEGATAPAGGPPRQPFSEPKPKMPKVEVVKGGLASQAEADKALADLQAKEKPRR